MIYFKSNYLADKLDVNLAKWKRWSREFLDPDPLGGYQSGVARQFIFKDAFRVFLGGQLVSVLNFTIPQARQILTDLNIWLKQNQFYDWSTPDNGSRINDQRWIHIYETDGGFSYAVRSVTRTLPPGTDGLCEEISSLELIGVSLKSIAEERFTHARLIHIDELHRYFIGQIDEG